MNLVFDTNVIISAALFNESIPSAALAKGYKIGQLLYSSALGEELKDIFFREKFNDYVALEKRMEFLNAFFKRAIFFEPTLIIQVCRDPKDNMILELAVAGQADCIVTGDKDLLALNPFRKIQILTPAEFLRMKK